MQWLSKLSATFGHIHNGYKKNLLHKKREREEASISYSFPTPSIQVCLLQEVTAAAEPVT